MKIYTKQGDEGKTSLLGGTRVAKSHARLDAYGTIDELNSLTGLLRTCSQEFSDIDHNLEVIQHRLFQVGSHLACDNDDLKQQLPAFKACFAEELEQQIDKMSGFLPELKHFILPGGSIAASQAHICRTVCRRAERLLFHISPLSHSEKEIGKYLNRLSDYFFVLARSFNQKLGVKDVTWRKDL